MFKLVPFTIVLAALLCQLTAVEASSKDEAKKLFHELMAAIDKVLTKAQNELNKASNTVEAEAAKVEDKAKAELDKMLVPLRKKLDDLVAEAKAKGFDLSKCQNYVDDFSNTPDDLVHNLVDCVNKQVENAQSLVNDALNNTKKIEQDLNTIDSDIDNCGGNPIKKAACYAKIIEKIAKETKAAPQHIIEDITKATALITSLVPKLETCAVTQLKKAGDDAAEDVEKFAACAALDVKI